MGSLIVIPIASALAVLAKRRFEETVFPAIGVITLTLTITGMLGSLNVGIYVLTLYLIVAVVLLIIKRADFQRFVITPGFSAFILFIVFFIIFSYGRFFLSEETLSQHGLVIRNMYDTGSLKDTCLYYDLNLPLPFVSVWAYFCTYTSGGFSEWICIFSYDIFIISAVLPLFSYIKSLKKESWQWLFMLLFCVLLPVLKLPKAYADYNVVIPQAVSMLYTYLIFRRLIFDKCSLSSAWWYAGFMAYGILMSCLLTWYAIYASVPLLMGICTLLVLDAKVRRFLLVGVGSGCLLATLLGIYGNLSAGDDVSGAFFIPECCLICVIMSVVFTIVIRMYEKGNWHVAAIVVCLMGVAIVALTVIILQNSPNKEYLMEWFMEYTNKLFVGRKEEADYIIGKRVVPIYDVTFLFIMMASSGWASGKIIEKDTSKALRLRAVNASIVFGTVLYLIVLCVLYINNIRQPHSALKPSIAAYVSPILMLAAVVVFTQSLKAWSKNLVIVIGTVVLLACVFSDPVGAVLNKPEFEDSFPLITACKDAEVLEFTEEDRVFYIDKDLNDNLPATFLWAVFPAGADSINGLYFNPEPYKWVDYIEEPLSAEDLANMLKDGNYTYVYLKNIDDSFKDIYYPDFANADADIRSDAVYRVEYSDQGMQIVYIAGVVNEEITEEAE